MGTESKSKIFPNITSNVTTFEVQTVPLFSILAAIDVSEIDYFVLDIQSLEEDVLHNFPFDRVHVKVRSKIMREFDLTRLAFLLKMFIRFLNLGLGCRSIFPKCREADSTAPFHGETGLFQGALLGITTYWIHGLYIRARVFQTGSSIIDNICCKYF